MDKNFVPKSSITPLHYIPHAILLLVVGGLGVFFLFQDRAVPGTNESLTLSEVVFLPLHVDRNRLELERREQMPDLKNFALSENEQNILGMIGDLNVEEALVRYNGERQLLVDKWALFHPYIRDYYRSSGPENFLKLGEVYYLIFLKSLNNLIYKLAEHNLLFEKVMTSGPEGCLPGSKVQLPSGCPKEVNEAVVEFIKRGGSFWQFARQEQLIDNEGTMTSEQELVVHILFRYRWVKLIQVLVLPQQLLTPYEYRLFLRWRVEGSTRNPRARLADVKALEESDLDYNGDFARGVLYAQSGDLNQATKYFKMALIREPDRQIIKEYVEITSKIQVKK